MDTTPSPPPERPAGAPEAHAHGEPGWGRFLRHYVEMVIVMFVGMGVFEAAYFGVLAATGSEVELLPEIAAVKMSVEMAAAMVIWMRIRRHAWPATLEMAAAMIVPVVVLLPLVWLGVMDGDGLMILEHVLMLPAMFIVMLFRRREYGAPR